MKILSLMKEGLLCQFRLGITFSHPSVLTHDKKKIYTTKRNK